MNKYKAIKTIVDNIKFDSKKEANRYCQLKLLLKANEIKDLKLQEKFILQESYKIDKKTIRAIIYIADFSYFDVKKNIRIIEDTKGFKNSGYLLKKKILLYKFPKINFIET